VHRATAVPHKTQTSQAKTLLRHDKIERNGTGFFIQELTGSSVVFQVGAAGGSSINKAGRNAVATSLMVRRGDVTDGPLW